MVVNKPSGLLTTAARGVDSLEIQLQAFLKAREGEGNFFVGLPHRIDRPVSGAVLVGKTPAATKLFCAQFQARTIEKTYVAVFEGVPEEPSGVWDDWMRKLPSEAHSEIVAEDHPDAKRAVLRYLRTQVSDGVCLVEIQLETGRTHQIRLQASSRGCPVLGDMQYGGKQSFGSQSTNPRQRSISLHARQIGFRHPKNGKPVEVKVPVTQDWLPLESRLPLIGELFDG